MPWRSYPVAKNNRKGSGSSKLCLEAPGGFEPPHRSFAACPRALRPMMINRDGQRRLIRKINKLWRFHYALPRLTRIPNREQNREWNRE